MADRPCKATIYLGICATLPSMPRVYRTKENTPACHYFDFLPESNYGFSWMPRPTRVFSGNREPHKGWHVPERRPLYNVIRFETTRNLRYFLFTERSKGLYPIIGAALIFAYFSNLWFIILVFRPIISLQTCTTYTFSRVSRISRREKYFRQGSLAIRLLEIHFIRWNHLGYIKIWKVQIETRFPLFITSNTSIFSIIPTTETFTNHLPQNPLQHAFPNHIPHHHGSRPHRQLFSRIPLLQDRCTMLRFQKLLCRFLLLQ